MTKSYSVPTKVIPDQALIRVLFSRDHNDDELDIMKANYAAGKIVTDPEVDLEHAMVNQLAFELQAAFDTGEVNGQFSIESIELGRGVDYAVMERMRAEDDKSRAIHESTQSLVKLLNNPAVSSALLEEDKARISQQILANKKLIQGVQPRVAPIGGIDEHH